MSEIEAESGFDKRTIAYYISQGLLPKVGRRGPKTRYPQDFLERLMFIRRVRDLQDDGKLRAVTLTEICTVMNELTADEIRTGARRGGSVAWIRDRFENPDWDTSGFAVPVEEVAAAMMPDREIEDWDVMEDAQRTPLINESVGAYRSRMAPASQRRDTLSENMKPHQLQADLELQLKPQQALMEKSRAIREQEMDELIHSIHRFEERMEKMNHAQREEMRYEMQEMKELVLGMHERLRDIEDRIKLHPETRENDSDSSE